MEKCPVLQCRRILQKFLDPDPEADDFQNLSSSPLSIDTSVVNKFCEGPFSSFLLEVANRQTDRQSNAGHYITSLADVKAASQKLM